MHIAQLNLARLLAPPDDPAIADFMGALERINNLGKNSSGFVWMMEGSGEPDTGDSGNNVDGDPQTVVNLTVWKNIAAMENFVWQTAHKQFYERRAEWFEVPGELHFVMWWVPEGHLPSLDEALARLEHLRVNGDSDYAFGWKYLDRRTALEDPKSQSGGGASNV